MAIRWSSSFLCLDISQTKLLLRILIFLLYSSKLQWIGGAHGEP